MAAVNNKFKPGPASGLNCAPNSEAKKYEHIGREANLPPREQTSRAKRFLRLPRTPVLLLLFFVAAFPSWFAMADLKRGDYAITHWTRENGLPDNSVTCLTRTRDGFLWIGTAKGLVRFDGVKFVSVDLPSAPAREAAEFTALFEDAEDRLWIGTRRYGLWFLEDGEVRPANSAKGFRGTAVTCLAGDAKGNLWIGTTNGLSRINGTSVTSFTSADGLPGDAVSDIHVSEPGAAWITTSKGMCQFKDGRLTPLAFQTESVGGSPQMIGIYSDQRGNLWAYGDSYLVNLNDGKRFNYFRSGDTMSLRIWTSCVGRDGQLWIGTSGQGLFSFADGRFRPLSLRDASLGSDIQAIYEDGEGNLWLGTFNNGLVRLQARKIQALDADTGLPVAMANCLSAGAEGRIWAGYSDEGLFAAKLSGHFEQCETEDGHAPINLITSIAATENGEIWIGSLGLGLFQFKDGSIRRITTENGLSDDEVLAVAAQSDGSIWAGTTSGTVHHFTKAGLTSFDQKSGLSVSAVSCLLPVSTETILVGAESGSLTRLERNEFVPVDNSSTLAGAPIRALCVDAAGRIWIGTQGKGLACAADGKTTVWDARAEFPENEINGILTDDSGRLWLATPRGIYVMAAPAGNIAPKTLPMLQLVKQYEPSSLPVGTQGWPQAVKGSDGRLWFAGPRAVYVLDPRDFQAAVSPFQVQLENILINGQPLAFRNTAANLRAHQPLRLPSNLRTLEIEFTTPCLASPERVQFQHRLDNIDKDWVDSGADRRIRYNGLPFGQYQFRVRAMNLDGTWGQENNGLLFVVPPPFWRLPAVIIAASVIAAIAIAAMARVFFHRHLRLKLARISQQEAMGAERMRIARDMHDEIGSRLTRISYFSELALQDETPSRQSIHSIANMIRELLKTLDEIVWAVNPQNDTLENLAAYLGYYVTEYLQNTSVDCKVNIPPSLPVCPLTAETRHNLFLAFEEAVSNALRHSGASCVCVDMGQHNGSFEIRIQDNGRGFDSAAKTAATNRESGPAKRGRKGNGLTNMRLRLASVGGKARIDSHAGQGTTVTFSLPVKNITENTP